MLCRVVRRPQLTCPASINMRLTCTFLPPGLPSTTYLGHGRRDVSLFRSLMLPDASTSSTSSRETCLQPVEQCTRATTLALTLNTPHPHTYQADSLDRTVRTCSPFGSRHVPRPQAATAASWQAAVHLWPLSACVRDAAGKGCRHTLLLLRPRHLRLHKHLVQGWWPCA